MPPLRKLKKLIGVLPASTTPTCIQAIQTPQNDLKKSVKLTKFSLTQFSEPSTTKGLTPTGASRKNKG